MLPTRLIRLKEALAHSAVDGIVLNAGPSLSYFTGLDFHLMERPVLYIYRPGHRPVLILPRLESAKLANRSDIDAFYYDEDPVGWSAVVGRALSQLNCSEARLAAEPQQFRMLEHDLITAAASVTLVDGGAETAAVRMIKESSEIELMQKAVAIAEEALRSMLPHIKKGVSEKEIAAELTVQLFRHGSEAELPFSPIVAAGPNAANPHAQPTERAIKNGDLLIIDWGASYAGYMSDITRTYAIGDIDAESLGIYRLVREANAAGRQAGAAGVSCAAVDRAARQIIESGGYGKYFTHRTGHGIGRQCHEYPYIHGANMQELKVGMCYTVEPGIYLPGKNGVRIEDDVYMSEGGPVSLVNLPRELVKLG